MRITDHETTESDGRLSLMLRIDLGPIEEAELPEIVELSPKTRGAIEAAIEFEQAEHWAELRYAMEALR